MGDFDIEESAGDADGRSNVLATDVAAMFESIHAADGQFGWLSGTRIDLGTFAWVPAAVSSAGDAVLHIALEATIPAHVKKRLRAAHESDLTPVVALTIEALFQPDIAILLSEIEADVLVVDDYVIARRFQPRSVMSAIADIEIPLPTEVRKKIALHAWSRIGEGTSHEKGRRLEGLLSFLLSQVGDLKVVERNLRTETEELDLVLQVDNLSTRVWQESGVPFILVEAKNTIEKVGQPVVSTLLTKLRTTRRRSKIALLVARGGFTRDAKLQELRFSSEDGCVVFIDTAEMETLIQADDVGDALEALVRRAMLR